MAARGAAAAGAEAGVAYWRDRARALGERSVISTDHDAAVADVSATHRRLLLPALAALLPLAPNGRVSIAPGAVGSDAPSIAQSGRTVLDLGCGSGRLTADLAALVGRAIGVDPVGELLALAPPSDRVEYRLLEAAGAPLPLDDGEVDVTFTCLVLGGIEDPADLATVGGEIERVLAPSGLIFLAESVSDQPAAGHWTFRSVDDYRAAMPWAGLQEIARFDDAGDAVSVMAGRKPA